MQTVIGVLAVAFIVFMLLAWIFPWRTGHAGEEAPADVMPGPAPAGTVKSSRPRPAPSPAPGRAPIH